jgi:hypothetical protein
MFSKFFGGKPRVDLAELFSFAPGKPSIVVLSGLCCNPMSLGVEDKLKGSVQTALEAIGVEAEVKSVSITEAQKLVSGLGKSHASLVHSIQGIFQTHGLKAFPALVINGELALYGGAPAPDAIERELRKHLAPGRC